MDAPQPFLPWYRQLWPWLLLAPPAASIVGGIAIIFVAIASDDGLVARDATLDVRSTGNFRTLTPAERAQCAARDRACLSAQIEEAR
jgi:hypothetical protein